MSSLSLAHTEWNIAYALTFLVQCWALLLQLLNNRMLSLFIMLNFTSQCSNNFYISFSSSNMHLLSLLPVVIRDRRKRKYIRLCNLGSVLDNGLAGLWNYPARQLWAVKAACLMQPSCAAMFCYMLVMFIAWVCSIESQLSAAYSALSSVIVYLEGTNIFTATRSDIKGPLNL